MLMAGLYLAFVNHWCRALIQRVLYAKSRSHVPFPIQLIPTSATPTLSHARLTDGKMATIRYVCLSIVVLLLAVKVEARSFTIDYDKDTFMKDGQPFR